MPKYVAFLRAINVGGHTVKMDYLRRLFEAMDFRNVETFIASGNVIFDSPSRNPRSLERKIQRSLLEALGFETATFIRSTAQLSEIAKCAPFGDPRPASPAGTLYIGFLADSPGPRATQALLSCATDADKFHLSDREVYWLCGTRFSESEFSGARLEKILGMQTTIRTSNTVKRLATKYSQV